MPIEEIPGGLLAVPEFVAGTAACGLKRRGPDLAVLFSKVPSAVAGTFTTNKVRAACAALSEERALSGRAQGVVVNSGNANACTGERGMRDAKEMAALAASACGVPEDSFLVASTGVIGVPLPMDRIRAGVSAAASSMGSALEKASDLVHAIQTTDRIQKIVSGRIRVGEREVILGGIAKGAGMIAPRMATMLAFLATNAAVHPKVLRQRLVAAVDRTFNRITVDGHTSTNDMVVLFANGSLGNAAPAKGTTPEVEAFDELLEWACERLAKAIVRDGEGATKFIEIRIEGAFNHEEARKAAFAVANSPLVKTAIHGGDPNWGRIVSAIGYAKTQCKLERMTLKVGGITLFDRGAPTLYDQNEANAVMARTDIPVEVDLGIGLGSTTVWTCDLSREYIALNADYTT